MTTFNRVSEFCLHYGLNHTDYLVDNDDSCHDIKEFLVYGYERFIVGGFEFIKGDVDIPKPIARLGSYSVFRRNNEV